MAITKIASTRVDHDYEDAGCDSYTLTTVYEMGWGTTNRQIELVNNCNHAVWRCQHEHDCCGHLYPSSPRVQQFRNYKRRERIMVVSQSFHQNV